jgi:hypothetical protein
MKTYPLTPQQFSVLRTRLLELGATLPAENEGTLSYSGIDLKYHYDGAALTLSILKRPIFVPASMIWEKVDEWVSSSLAS